MATCVGVGLSGRVSRAPLAATTGVRVSDGHESSARRGLPRRSTGGSPSSTLLNVAEAASYLRVTRNTVYKMCSEGRIPHQRVGARRGCLRFDVGALEAWMETFHDPGEGPVPVQEVARRRREAQVSPPRLRHRPGTYGQATVCVKCGGSTYLTTAEAAAYLRVSVGGLRERAYRRAIPAYHLGGRLLFERGELDEWLRQHPAGPHRSTRG